MGVDEFVCFQNIYSYISQQCLLWSNGTFTFVLPHYMEYYASNRPTEHDNLPVLIQYTDTGRPFFALSIDMLRHTRSQVCQFLFLGSNPLENHSPDPSVERCFIG